MEFNDFTFFYSFRKDNRIYLILSINNPPNVLRIEFGNNNVHLSQSYVKNCYEPVKINIYDRKSSLQQVNKFGINMM